MYFRGWPNEFLKRVDHTRACWYRMGRGSFRCVCSGPDPKETKFSQIAEE